MTSTKKIGNHPRMVPDFYFIHHFRTSYAAS